MQRWFMMYSFARPIATSHVVPRAFPRNINALTITLQMSCIPRQRGSWPSQHLRLEQLAIFAGLGARDHELAIAPIMNRLRMFRRSRDMRLHHFEHEQAVFPNQARIRQPAFEIGVALLDQRRANLCAGRGGEAELGELVDVATGTIANPDHLG